MAQSEYDLTTENRGALVRMLDAIGWGIFLIWLGIAFLVGVGWGVGLFGVGVIALGAQAARKYFGLRVEPFGLVIGIGFVVWGTSEVLDIHMRGGVLPSLCIVAGILLVVSALRRKPRN